MPCVYFHTVQVVLVFTTLGINSCAEASNVERLDAQIDDVLRRPPFQPMQEAAAVASATGEMPTRQDGLNARTPPAIVHCRHIRWLLHWARSTVMNHMGAAAYLAGDKERQVNAV
jgi:hypothetical protein